jgi:hypothetical protein
MKPHSLHGSILLAGVALVVVTVVALTTLPSSIGIIRLTHNITLIQGHPNANDAVGHAALYATLTAVVYWALRRRIGFSRAFWAALLTGLLLGAFTELAQHFSPGRATLLSDLLANWLGVMTVVALIGYRQGATRGR